MGPADVRLIFFSDSKYLETKVECSVELGDQASPWPAVRSLCLLQCTLPVTERLPQGHLPVCHGREMLFDSSLALGLASPGGTFWCGEEAHGPLPDVGEPGLGPGSAVLLGEAQLQPAPCVPGGGLRRDEGREPSRNSQAGEEGTGDAKRGALRGRHGAEAGMVTVRNFQALDCALSLIFPVKDVHGYEQRGLVQENKFQNCRDVVQC